MNRVNVQKAIRVMERVRDQERGFDLTAWQRGTLMFYEDRDFNRVYVTREHECQTACCFAGWLAISPEWREQSGTVGDAGIPMFGQARGTGAIAAFLDIPLELAALLTGSADYGLYGSWMKGRFYLDKYAVEVTPQDVIEKLQWLLTLPDDPKQLWAVAISWKAILA